MSFAFSPIWSPLTLHSIQLIAAEYPFFCQRNKAPKWWIAARRLERERDAFHAEHWVAWYAREAALRPAPVDEAYLESLID
jgi:hypothetical protein